MNADEVTGRLLACWSFRLGCEGELLTGSGNYVLPHSPLWTPSDVVRLCNCRESCVLLAPDRERPRLEKVVKGQKKESVARIEFIREIYGRRLKRISGPFSVSYLSQPGRGLRVDPDVRNVTREDIEVLGRYTEIHPSEYGYKLFRYLDELGFEEPFFFGYFVDGLLASFAMLNEVYTDVRGGWARHGMGTCEANLSPGSIANIGVMTHREHRRKGFGKAAVVGLTKALLERQAIIEWSTAYSNVAAMAIGRSLGFKPVGPVLSELQANLLPDANGS